MRSSIKGFANSFLNFMAGLILAPVAPLIFWWQWVFLKDREYAATKTERKSIVFERLIQSFFIIIGIILLVWFIDNIPSDYDGYDDNNQDEACVPYGNCY